MLGKFCQKNCFKIWMGTTHYRNSFLQPFYSTNAQTTEKDLLHSDKNMTVVMQVDFNGIRLGKLLS